MFVSIWELLNVSWYIVQIAYKEKNNGRIKMDFFCV